MSLYPSLEDMKADQLMKAQNVAIAQSYPSVNSSIAPPPYNATFTSLESTSENSVMYPALGEYMGLELSAAIIEANMPEYNQVALMQTNQLIPSGLNSQLIAPLSGQSLGLQRAQVTHGVRETEAVKCLFSRSREDMDRRGEQPSLATSQDLENCFTAMLILCKDKDNKVGLRVKPINNGVFVCLVIEKSPAALAGLRFGDQILQINGTNVAGYNMDKVHDLFRKSPVNGISVVVRDRPFERTITLHKDSTAHVGFQFKNGKIVNIVKDSSAARNGVLTEHQILEIDGQNVVGMKDKEVTKLIEKTGSTITITVIPNFIYDHMIKKMSGSILKDLMDHSIPTL